MINDRLTRKNEKYVCIKEREHATSFQGLKIRLTNATILVMSKGNEDVIIYIDALGLG